MMSKVIELILKFLCFDLSLSYHAGENNAWNKKIKITTTTIIWIVPKIFVCNIFFLILTNLKLCLNFLNIDKLKIIFKGFGLRILNLL